jgi:hypothetical protein
MKWFESAVFSPQYGPRMMLFFLFSNLDKYDPFLLQRNFKLDYKMALEMMPEILLMEFIHRIVVCLFEVRICHILPPYLTGFS